MGSGSGPELKRRLGPVDAAAIFVGIILGSGIFVAPSAMSSATPSALLSAALWILGGAVTICGAFCYAECGARLPRTGGFYVFYREAFGDAPAFVGGWVALFVTYPASVAAIALVFGQYLGEIVPWAAGRPAPAAACAIVAAAALNAAGVRAGTLAQTVLTGAKVAALGTLCVAALASPAPQRFDSPEASGTLLPAGLAGLLTALVVLLWTYDGWSDVTLVSGEIRSPGRNLARAVLAGTAVLVILYVAVQLSVSSLLSPGRAAASPRVLAEAAQVGLGPRAGRFVAALAVVSTFGSINGIVLAVSRLAFAMARDGAFVRWFGRVHPTRETPARATGALAVASVFYVFAGDFRNLLQYFSFSVWIFYGLTAVALLVLRRRGVGDGAEWTAPGGVLAPAVVLVTAAGMTSGLMVQNPRNAIVGLAMLGAGFPLYAVWRRWAGGAAAR